MKKLICLLALLAMEYAVSSLAAAAILTIHLYDRQGRPLNHGDALIMVESPLPNGPGAKWTANIGLYTQSAHYSANLPDEQVLNVTIYTNQNTLRRDITGVYGRKNQSLHLLADPEHMERCGSFDTEYGISSDVLDLVDQLDRAYPNGVPADRTNIKRFLEETVLRTIDRSENPEEPELAKKKNDFRQRVMRHIQAR